MAGHAQRSNPPPGPQDGPLTGEQPPDSTHTHPGVRTGRKTPHSESTGRTVTRSRPTTNQPTPHNRREINEKDTNNGN